MSAIVTPKPIQEITDSEQLLAIIIYSNFKKPGIHFFTPNTLSQQLAYMRHPAGKKIEPHVHNSVPREVYYGSFVYQKRETSGRFL
jgi:hypothetical protein